MSKSAFDVVMRRGSMTAVAGSHHVEAQHGGYCPMRSSTTRRQKRCRGRWVCGGLGVEYVLLVCGREDRFVVVECHRARRDAGEPGSVTLLRYPRGMLLVWWSGVMGIRSVGGVVVNI